MGVLVVKQKMWLDIIKDQKASGKSVRVYCEERGLSEKSYWYYHHKFSNALETRMVSELSQNDDSSIVEYSYYDQRVKDITIKHGSVSISVSEDISDGQLLRLIRVISNA